MGNVIKMSEAKLPVKRIGKTTAIDAEGSKVRTKAQVKALGTEERTGAGRPRIFKDADDPLGAFTDYIDHIRLTDFSEVATRANFPRWIGADRKTGSTRLSEHTEVRRFL